MLGAVCLCVSAPLLAQQHPAGAQDPSQHQQPTYAVAVAVPLSGKYAPLGKQVLQAARIAARDAGVRLVSKDTEGTPRGAITAVSALAKDDSVLAVIGPIGEHESRAAAVVAQRAGLPLFALASDDAVNRVGNWVYRLRTSPAEQAAGLAVAVRKAMKAQERVGIFFPESVYGQQAAVAFARAFEAHGGRVTAVASYPADTTDFRKPLAELVGTRVHLGRRARAGKHRADRDGYLRVRHKPTVDFDLMFIPDYHQRVARMLPFLPGAGLQNGDGGDGVAVQMLGLSGWQGSSMRLTGAQAAGAIYSDVYVGAADGGRAEDFARMFEGKTGRQPVNLDAEVFDSTWMIAKIIARRVDHAHKTKTDPSTAALRLAVANHRPAKAGFRGVCGAFGFGPQGQPLRPVRLYQFDIGGSVTPYR